MKERTVGPGRGPGGRTGLKRHDGNRPIQRRGDHRQGGPGSAQGLPGLVAHQRPRISARGISALGSSPDASSPKASTTATVDDPSRPGSWTGRQGASIRTRICAYMRAGRTRICAQGMDRGTPRPWTGGFVWVPQGRSGKGAGELFLPPAGGGGVPPGSGRRHPGCRTSCARSRAASCATLARIGGGTSGLIPTRATAPSTSPS